MSNYLEQTIHLHEEMVRNLDLQIIERIADQMAQAYRENRKVLIFGNGGSAADALHFQAELEGQLSSIDKERRPLRALTPCNLSAITAISNDFGYEHSFSRFAQANVEPGDVVVGISTSGNSPNVVRAIEMALSLKAFAIGLTGRNGGRLKALTHLCLTVPADHVPLIQEGHVIAYHRICDLIIGDLFGIKALS